MTARRGRLDRDKGTTSIALPGTILGIGLGGFVDGVLLHQVLQWHHLLTSTDSDIIGIEYYPADTVHGLQMNTLWDGLFHTFTWLSVLIGLGLLYSRVTRSRGRLWTSRALWGWILLGWGLFNLVEGVINHHILGIHHVRSGSTRHVGKSGFWSPGRCWSVAVGSCNARRRRWMSAVPTTRRSTGDTEPAGSRRSPRVLRVHRRDLVALGDAVDRLGRLCGAGPPAAR